MKVERFEDIRAWQQARELSNLVYDLTEQGKFAKDFRLRDQFKAPLVRLCTTSPKDSMTAPTLNLFTS
jgi:hypothetical protein